LAACGAEPVWAPDEALRQAAYRAPGPARVTLFTMISTTSGSGAHTGLMINASQRVIWDPAGTFSHPSIPERNDLVFGITERVEQFYVTYHARESFYVLRQEVDVSDATAEALYRTAQTAGPVPKAQCTVSTVRLLNDVGSLGRFRSSYFPKALSDQFADLPGVRTREHRETDSDNNREVLRTYWSGQ
jgi:hypothetical protein